jgi:hypothetical protein
MTYRRFFFNRCGVPSYKPLLRVAMPVRRCDVPIGVSFLADVELHCTYKHFFRVEIARPNARPNEKVNNVV